jgi:hypothetical protein
MMLFGIGLLNPAVAQTSPGDNFGFIRFIHAAIDVAPLDIYTGDTGQTLLVSNLAYGQATDFMALPSTTQGFVARAAGTGVDGDMLFKLNRRVKANQSEIIAAAGLGSQRAFVLEPLVLVRDATRGKARIRVFNLVWGGPYLTVKDSRGMTLGQDLQYLSSAGDTDVDPGTYDFEIRSGGGAIVTTETNVTLEADKIYALMILGGMDGTPPIHFVILVADQETTRVRIVNKSNATADVYIKGDDRPFVAGLAPDASTDLIPVPSGATTFILRVAGSAPNSTEIAFVAPQLRPGRDVTISINGAGVATQMGVTEDHPTPGLNTPLSTPVATDAATQPG